MQDELNQFEINDVWELVLRPKKSIHYRNKMGF